jgi:hypothetical protein
MSMLANERTKLLANALDRASTACFTVGVATPLAGWVYGLAGLRESLDALTLLIGISGWLLGALALHVLGRWVLAELR